MAYSTYVPPFETLSSTAAGDGVLIRHSSGLLATIDPSLLGGGGGAVASVNGHTGAVVLAASDVGAQPAGSYLGASAIPAATNALLGGSGTAGAASAITVGSGLTLSGMTLTASGGAISIPNASLVGGNGSTLTSIALGNGLSLTSGTLSASGGSSTPTPRIVTASGAVTILAGDGLVKINKTTGAATAVTLEASPVTGAVHTIKDGKGDAATNPITITPASGTIDGASNFVLNTNRAAVTLEYDGVEWSVI